METDGASSATVVLLHGMARTSRSFNWMAQHLEREGYRVINLGYPSRKYGTAELAPMVRAEILRRTASDGTVHIVAHSLGGILVRCWQEQKPLPNLGRVVMLSPPNRGSEVADTLRKRFLYRLINGPVGQELGTGEDSVISRLGPVGFELGVLTGDRSINWILSTMIPGPNDGKVSTERARVEGMADFKVVHATHPMIMRNKRVFREVVCFLENGKFLPESL